MQKLKLRNVTLDQLDIRSLSAADAARLDGIPASLTAGSQRYLALGRDTFRASGTLSAIACKRDLLKLTLMCEDGTAWLILDQREIWTDVRTLHYIEG